MKADDGITLICLKAVTWFLFCWKRRHISLRIIVGTLWWPVGLLGPSWGIPGDLVWEPGNSGFWGVVRLQWVYCHTVYPPKLPFSQETCNLEIWRSWESFRQRWTPLHLHSWVHLSWLQDHHLKKLFKEPINPLRRKQPNFPLMTMWASCTRTGILVSTAISCISLANFTTFFLHTWN